MANILRRSLKIRVFVIFLAVSIAGVSLIGSISYFTGMRTLESTISESYTGLAQKTEGAVVDYMDSLKVEFKMVDGDHYVGETVSKIVNKDPDASRLSKDITGYLKGFLTANPDAIEYFVLDMSGKVIISTDDKHVGIDRVKDPYFVEGQKKYFIKDVYKSDTINQISFVLSGPLLAPGTKTLLGVLGVRYNTVGLNAITTDRIGMGQTGEIYIVNKDGIMITESRHAKGLELKQKVETEPVKLWQTQGKDMTGVYPDFNGQPVLGATMGEDLSKSIDNLGWLIVAEIDTVEAFSPIHRLGITILLIGLGVSLVIALIGFFVAQGIANPITKIAQLVQKVGEGDLTQEIDESKSVDEIGTLSNSFRETVRNLRDIVTRVMTTSERLSSSAEELSSAAEEMNATTEQVSATVEQISKGTEKQAQGVEQTKKVMDQMASSVMQVTQSAQSAAGQASKAAAVAQKGGVDAKDAQAKMVSMAIVIGKAADGVRSLGNRSDQIGEIVGVITGIADQTNLLALNAAIEAARAGEYGRGFAVVAEEVRKLAEGSAKAADEIGKLIKDVQKETAGAVQNIEGTAKEVTVVTDIAVKVGQGMDEIIKNSESVASMIEQVSAATQEQASGTKMVTQSVGDIAAIAEENASATEQASASTEEMTASMEEMAASAQELAEMGVQLRDMVAQFKVGDVAKRTALIAGSTPSTVRVQFQHEGLKTRVEGIKKKFTGLKHRLAAKEDLDAK